MSRSAGGQTVRNKSYSIGTTSMFVFTSVLIVTCVKLWGHHLSFAAESFVHTPGSIQVCEADDLVLRWSFWNESLPSIREINWYHTEGRDRPIGRWTETSGAVFFEPYKNRAKPLIGSNAGIVISNVTSADGGQYVIDTGITPDSVSDTVEVHVYSDSFLVPTLTASGDSIAFNTTLYVNGTSVVFNVITARILQADIVIATEGSEIAKCPSNHICKGVVNVLKQEAIVTFTLVYHVCEPFEDVIYLKTRKAAQDVGTSGAGVTVACALVFLVLPLLTITVLVIVWFVLRKKQKKGTRLSAGQRQYVECAVLYQLTRCPGWGPEDVKSDTDPEGTVTTPLSGKEDYYKEDGDTVEIPDSAVQNMPPTDIYILDKAKYKITSIPSRILDFFQSGDTAAAELESRDDNEKTNIPNQKDTETTEDTSQLPGASEELPSKSAKDVTDPDQVAVPVGHISITKDKKKQRKEEARRLAAEKKEQDNNSGDDVDQGSTSDGNASCGGKETLSEDKGATEERDSKKGAEKSTHESFKEAQANKTLVKYGAAGGIV